jgi:hypothetical protein
MIAVRDRLLRLRDCSCPLARRIGAWPAVTASDQEGAAVDGEHGAGDEAVVHQVEAGGGDLVRLADCLGDGPLGQRGEYR